jgi:hypothetical protein
MIGRDLQRRKSQLLQLTDFAPDLGSFREEVLCGLRKPQKALTSKFFYHEQGSELFDLLCALHEYYFLHLLLPPLHASYSPPAGHPLGMTNRILRRAQ